jgi:hypothetical protein
MGKLIKLYFPNPQKEEKENNIKQLKKLIDWHIPENKRFVEGKIKKEQLT